MTSPFSEEKFLLEELKAGNRNAFIYLYSEYRYWMLLQALSVLGEETAAQDLVNELFADFWEFKLYENIKTTLKGYLSTAVRNRAYTYRRSSIQREQKMRALPVQEYLLPDLDISHDELIDKVETALKKLPPKMQEVFTYFFIDGLSHKQIASLTGKSRHTVNNQIDQAKKILKKELKK
jgi:RNA polymerase sigma-70 factor (ECF subfamily)